MQYYFRAFASFLLICFMVSPIYISHCILLIAAVAFSGTPAAYLLLPNAFPLKLRAWDSSMPLPAWLSFRYSIFHRNFRQEICLRRTNVARKDVNDYSGDFLQTCQWNGTLTVYSRKRTSVVNSISQPNPTSVASSVLHHSCATSTPSSIGIPVTVGSSFATAKWLARLMVMLLFHWQ